MDDETRPVAGPEPPAPPPTPQPAGPPPAMEWTTPDAPTSPPSSPPVSWQAPAAVVSGIPVPGSTGVFFAGMWPRFAAWLVDALLMFLLNVLIAVVVAAVTRSTQAPITAIAGVVVSLLYLLPQWRGNHRATFGMRAFSIQIGNAFDGVALTQRQALLRWAALGYPIGLLGALPTTAGIGGLLILLLNLALFLTTLGSPTRQGWHDQVANSAVVRRPGSTGSNTAAIALVVILVVVLFLFVPFLVLVLLGSQISNILSSVGSSI